MLRFDVLSYLAQHPGRVIIKEELLAAASHCGQRSRVRGEADHVALLDAGAQQYDGIALAFGRKKLARGAQLIEEAVSKIERLAKKAGTDATSPQSLFLLGCIHAEMGRKEAGLSYLRRAVAAEPGNIEYRKTLDQLEGASSALLFAGSAQGQSLIKWLIVLPFKVFIVWPLRITFAIMGFFLRLIAR